MFVRKQHLETKKAEPLAISVCCRESRLRLIEIAKFPERHFWHGGYDKAKYLTAGERDAFLRQADVADRSVRTLCMTLAYAGCPRRWRSPPIGSISPPGC